MLANKNVVLMSSALESARGVISKEDRLQQTIDTIKNVREKIPECFILFTDGSPGIPSEESRQVIQSMVDFSVYMGNNEQIKQFAEAQRNSEAESCLLIHTLMLFKQHPEIMKLLHSTKRIFKISARSELINNFNINIYDNPSLYAKYVFKERIPTWISDKTITTHLLITRFYSFCPSLIDDYIQTLQRVLNSCLHYGIDFENAHFREMNKKYLIELKKIYCKGIMATTGKTEIY